MATNQDKELQDLKDELAKLKADMSSIADTMGKIARNSAEQGRERIKSAADQSRAQARESWGAFEKEVSERPMTSLAVALGLGFVMGKLLDR